MSAALLTVAWDAPWLEAWLPEPMAVLSWAPYRGGEARAERIVWREVRNADLPDGFDAEAWLAAECQATERGDAVAMITSRSVACYELAQASVDGIRAACLATVGLSNAERVGHRRAASATVWGTVNLAIVVSRCLTAAARVEAMSVAAEARTAALMEAAQLELPTGRATGTGTDCIALASPVSRDTPAAYAGLHTALGEALGRVVFDAVAAGARRWREEQMLESAAMSGRRSHG